MYGTIGTGSTGRFAATPPGSRRQRHRGGRRRGAAQQHPAGPDLSRHRPAAEELHLRIRVQRRATPTRTPRTRSRSPAARRSPTSSSPRWTGRWSRGTCGPRSSTCPHKVTVSGTVNLPLPHVPLGHLHRPLGRPVLVDRERRRERRRDQRQRPAIHPGRRRARSPWRIRPSSPRWTTSSRARTACRRTGAGSWSGTAARIPWQNYLNARLGGHDPDDRHARGSSCRSTCSTSSTSSIATGVCTSRSASSRRAHASSTPSGFDAANNRPVYRFGAPIDHRDHGVRREPQRRTGRQSTGPAGPCRSERGIASDRVPRRGDHRRRPHADRAGGRRAGGCASRRSGRGRPPRRCSSAAACRPSGWTTCMLGCANQAGEDNRNVARMALLLAGLPVEVPGQTVNRLCGSGLQAVASAAHAIRVR